MLRSIAERILNEFLVFAPLLSQLFQSLRKYLATQQILPGLQRSNRLAREAHLLANRRTQTLRLCGLCRDHAVALLIQSIMQIGQHGAMLLLQYLCRTHRQPVLHRQQHDDQKQYSRD